MLENKVEGWSSKIETLVIIFRSCACEYLLMEAAEGGGELGRYLGVSGEQSNTETNTGHP
jgi:hypothetical protein